ncbi:hypothetical protein [uncultured Thiohalocapsa sp.]|uniref:hypothetical protein n=1 Tax=uncultured Thiohalocapsa sp. TaxID=768990 RepID=UPI0025FD7BE1|nr:hypothetical protein [uncultured Thiohalocapsa sp.]
MNMQRTFPRVALLAALFVAALPQAQGEALGISPLRQLPVIDTDASGTVTYNAASQRFAVNTASFATQFEEGVNTFWDFASPRSIEIDFVVDTAGCAPNAGAPTSCAVLPGAGLSPTGASLRVIGTIPTKG